MHKYQLLKRKGQIIASDFLASIAIFTIILLACMSLWNIVEAKYDMFGENELMERKAYFITDMLLKTQGYPADWNSGNVELIGISSEKPHVLDESKLIGLNATDYDTVKSIWGITDYEFYMKFVNSSGGTQKTGGGAINLEYGKAPSSQRDLVAVKRLGLINYSGSFERTNMVFMIWR